VCTHRCGVRVNPSSPHLAGGGLGRGTKKLIDTPTRLPINGEESPAELTGGIALFF